MSYRKRYKSKYPTMQAEPVSGEIVMEDHDE